MLTKLSSFALKFSSKDEWTCGVEKLQPYILNPYVSYSRHAILSLKIWTFFGIVEIKFLAVSQSK